MNIRLEDMMNIKIKKLHPDAVLPTYATDGSSGFDLVALEDVTFGPGETKLVKTGLAMAIPKGYELQVRPRSGVSLKSPFRVANAPGTVDSDYRGEICVIITNTSRQHLTVTLLRGKAIAQGVICPVVIPETFEVVDSLDETVRGEGGFGSTDVKINDPKNAKACVDLIRKTNKRIREDSEVLTELEQVEFFLQANGIYYEEGSNNGITPFIFLHFDDNGKATKE